MPNTINGANYLSASQLAATLRRNKVSVYRAIKRLRISHAFELNGFKFYGRASLAKLEKGMRRRNGHNGDGVEVAVSAASPNGQSSNGDSHS